MEYILRASSSLYWMLGTTLFFVTVFHWLWIFRYPLAMKQWKAVEYVWVLLAFLSALGLVDESRRFQAETRIAGDLVSAEVSLEQLGAWYRSYAEYSCTENTDLPSINDLCPDFLKAMSDFELLIATEGPVPPIPKPLINLPAAQYPIEAKIHDSRFENYHNARNHYLEAQASSQRSMIQQSLIILAPLLFAIAIALKLTKVTGEYLLTKK